MFYARQAPRGFVNETLVYGFATKSARDAWVDLHYNDGGCNSALCGARACSAKEARKILAYKGNAVTKSYNAFLVG